MEKRSRSLQHVIEQNCDAVPDERFGLLASLLRDALGEAGTDLSSDRAEATSRRKRFTLASALRSHSLKTKAHLLPDFRNDCRIKRRPLIASWSYSVQIDGDAV